MASRSDVLTCNYCLQFIGGMVVWKPHHNKWQDQNCMNDPFLPQFPYCENCVQKLSVVKIEDVEMVGHLIYINYDFSDITKINIQISLDDHIAGEECDRLTKMLCTHQLLEFKIKQKDK